MPRNSSFSGLVALLLSTTACSDNGGGSASGGAGGNDAGNAGSAGVGATAGSSASGGSSGAGAGGSGAGAGSGGTASCTAARDALLGPIDAVSTAGVNVVDQSGGVATLSVDATAGGFAEAKSNPYLYVKLSGTSKVAISDLQADASSDWDLAFKRDIIRTNGADSGPGSAGAAKLAKPFAEVSAADVPGASLARDEFLDDECNPIVDATGKPVTAFSEWYDYDGGTMTLTPKALTFVVRGADGQSHYKLEIVDYYATLEAGPKVSAMYTIRVAPL